MFTPHAPALDVYLLGYGGTLIYSLSCVRVIVPGVGVRDVLVHTGREYQPAYTHTPRILTCG